MQTVRDPEVLAKAKVKRERVRDRVPSIYEDPVSEELYTMEELEAILSLELTGFDLDFKPRTRSKVAKTAVARALGYEPPASFARTQPRFPAQNLDVYVQSADNLQIWNEEVDIGRRFVLIRPAASGDVVAVRVLSGRDIAQLDATGTLTHKFQARRKPGRTGSELVSANDTSDVIRLLGSGSQLRAVLGSRSSGDAVRFGEVLPIQELYRAARTLVGRRLQDPGLTQDRLRGEALQQVFSDALGIGLYANRGDWPDLRSQLTEVKLQTSPTIDLGAVSPSSSSSAGLGLGLRHSDIRYLVAYADAVEPGWVAVTAVVVTTGGDFFTEFDQFGGRVINSKLQLPLPPDLFR